MWPYFYPWAKRHDRRPSRWGVSFETDMLYGVTVYLGMLELRAHVAFEEL